MQLNTKKSFLKTYNKLQNRDKDKVDNALIIFSKNPIDTKLRNHSVSPRFP
jgi:mRNA-degrading endonuclease YafQ of YafQ-DinJ toxin-antitoxin module